MTPGKTSRSGLSDFCAQRGAGMILGNLEAAAAASIAGATV